MIDYYQFEDTRKNTERGHSLHAVFLQQTATKSTKSYYARAEGGGGTPYNGLYGETPPERRERYIKGREIGHLGI